MRLLGNWRRLCGLKLLKCFLMKERSKLIICALKKASNLALLLERFPHLFLSLSLSAFRSSMTSDWSLQEYIGEALSELSSMLGFLSMLALMSLLLLSG